MGSRRHRLSRARDPCGGRGLDGLRGAQYALLAKLPMTAQRQPSQGRRLCFAAVAALALAAPLSARDSLGVFSNWGAFRDPGVPRCYAIAQPFESDREGDYRAFASVGTWPRRNVRGQVHLRLSHRLAEDAAITLIVGDRRFELTGGGGDAWARDKAMDAAIVAAMRAAGRMTVTARDSRGRRFSDRYDLTGAATAIDAATVGCARVTS